MTCEPLVSVVMPAYNSEKYIRRSIDSILSQSYINFELIIVNDGSTDETEGLIQSYQDSRIKLLNLEKNIGVIGALNKGLSLAVGVYLARMDDDDVSLVHRFSKQVRFLENNKDYVACGSSIINFNDHGSSEMIYPTEHEQILSALKLFERNICHPSVMIRMKTLKSNSIKYRSEYVHAEDYVLWNELARCGKLYNFKESLIWYNRHQGQVSATHYASQIAVSRSIVEKNLEDFFSLKTNKLPARAYIDLLVQESGNHVRYLSPSEAKVACKELLMYVKDNTDMDFMFSKKILLFKLLRASFQYKYSVFEKIKAVFLCVASSPSLTIQNCSDLYKLYSIKKIKDGALS